MGSKHAPQGATVSYALFSASAVQSRTLQGLEPEGMFCIRSFFRSRHASHFVRHAKG